MINQPHANIGCKQCLCSLDNEHAAAAMIIALFEKSYSVVKCLFPHTVPPILKSIFRHIMITSVQLCSQSAAMFTYCILACIELSTLPNAKVYRCPHKTFAPILFPLCFSRKSHVLLLCKTYMIQIIVLTSHSIKTCFAKHSPIIMYLTIFTPYLSCGSLRH